MTDGMTFDAEHMLETAAVRVAGCEEAAVRRNLAQAIREVK